MTAVLPITLAPANATSVSESARPFRAAAKAGAAVAEAGRVLARITSWGVARMGFTTELRLGVRARRDIGLLPEQGLDGPCFGPDEIRSRALVWRV